MRSMLIGSIQKKPPPFLAETRSLRKRAFFIDRRICLGDVIRLLFEGAHVFDVVRDAPVDHFPVRRLDETVFVDPRVGGERRDQTDVRPFRRLDRAHPAVVGRVNVAHLETRPSPG